MTARRGSTGTTSDFSAGLGMMHGFGVGYVRKRGSGLASETRESLMQAVAERASSEDRTVIPAPYGTLAPTPRGQGSRSWCGLI